MDEFDLSQIDTYSAEQLAAFQTQMNERLDALLASESPTVAEADEAEQIVAHLAAIETASAALVTASTDAVERMAALRAGRVEASDDAAAAADEDDDEDEEDEEDEPEASTEASAVTASSRPAPKARARQRVAGARPATPPAASAPKPIAITAAADVPGFSTGADINIDDVATALSNRLRAFGTTPQGIKGAAMQRYGVAQFSRHFDDDFKTDGSAADFEKVMKAAKESRLPGGNLIAAGGWCAPSETLYDLCDGETTDGLIDLPEIGVSRGGIRFTPGPQFSTLYSAGFTQTEAQAIAGTSKPCYEITCPAFEEVRLDAMGICIKVPLLTNAGYPELTRRVVSGSLTAHLHRVSAALITKMVAEAGAAIPMADVGSGASNLLNSAAVIATTIRQEFRLGISETLEVVLPQWVREVFRADLANRNGVDLLAVTDAQIDGYFAARNLRVQWVYNWQDITDGQEGFPATAQMLVYPAGTFVRGSADVINLDAVYDAASLSTNTMTGLFFEEGVLLAQTCFKVKLATINTKTAGVTGSANNTAQFVLV